MQQQEYTLSKDPKDSTIKQCLIEQNTRCEVKAVKAVEVLPLVTPEESSTNLLDWYYFALFQDCENMLFMD